jgi:hypothetical protein
MIDKSSRLRLAIAHDQLEQAYCDVEERKSALYDSTTPLGLLWEAQDRLWFWNLAARILVKPR